MADKITNLNVLQLDGNTETVGTPSIVVLQRDPAGKVMRAQGASVPTDGDAGYAIGCIFTKTGNGVGTTLYMNEGSATSADFNAITTSAGVADTWESLYATDNTFDVAGGTGFKINGAMANSNDVLTIVADAAASGDALQFSQLGSGNDVSGTGSTWTFTKAGVNTMKSTTIAGTAGSNSLVLTAGDALFSDASLTIVDADDAATLSITNDTATSASPFVFAGAGVFTGNTTSSFMTITPSGLTTGTALYMPVAGMTTGKAINIPANALTSGIVLNLTSSATAITGAGRLIYSNHTGATGTSAILNEFASAANDETVIFKVTSSAALALGTALQVSGASITTGKAMEASDLNALTTGKGLHLASSATAITTTGRLFLSDHTGATGTSAVLNEFKSAANDETIVLQVTGSAALAAGKLMFLSAAAITTGTVLDISGSTATTTGSMLNINDNSSDTSTRKVVYIKQDHASASGATPLTIDNDNATKPLIAGTATATSTNYFKIMTVNSVTLWVGNGTTGNGNLSGTAGDILFNGGSNKPEYCTGTTNWTALV